MSSKGAYTTIVDSGTTLIVLPPDDFKNLEKRIKKKVGKKNYVCAFNICIISKECSEISSKFEPLYFGFDSYLQFSVPSSAYLLSGKDVAGIPGTCVVGVMGMEFK